MYIYKNIIEMKYNTPLLVLYVITLISFTQNIVSSFHPLL